MQADQDKDAYIVLIPAYQPDDRLLTLCATLQADGIQSLVIDDGSDPACKGIFDALVRQGTVVLHHAVNLGKGRALKTGINEAMQRYPALKGLITADADGQHTPLDIARLIAAMRQCPDALVIGARAFTGDVPFKSRAGNAITRVVYRFVTGIHCSDTQTGLRGIPASILPAMLRLKGERYEYEMTMLLKLRDMQLPLAEVPIETIYIDENKGSHFRPLRDAARIYSVILTFLFSSLLSFCIDYGLYLILLNLTGNAAGLSYAIARALSSTFNFSINRMAVFGSRGGKGSVLRYYLLAAVLLLIGYQAVHWLNEIWPLHAAFIKIPVDVFLFFISYAVQRDFVFGLHDKRKTTIRL